MPRWVKIGRAYINLDGVKIGDGLDRQLNLTPEESALLRRYLECVARPWRPRVLWPEDDEGGPAA